MEIILLQIATIINSALIFWNILDIRKERKNRERENRERGKWNLK